VSELLAMPREWLASTGEMGRFCALIVRDVWGARVLKFFGEALRQAGILILGSTIVIWSLVFITGLGPCGIEAAYFNQSVGAPTYSGVFAAWCNLREAVPYAFGYMMSAKVGTGIVAELGAMRISEEIDALEVMGINSVTFLCATRLLAAWMVLPFMYLSAIGVGYLASYIAVVKQIGYVSAGGYLLIFWQFQNPTDLLYSVIKGMFMATAIVLVACYYGYHASGGPVGVGTATAKSMVLNRVIVTLIVMLGTQVFWGANPRALIGGRAGFAPGQHADRALAIELAVDGVLERHGVKAGRLRAAAPAQHDQRAHHRERQQHCQGRDHRFAPSWSPSPVVPADCLRPPPRGRHGGKLNPL